MIIYIANSAFSFKFHKVVEKDFQYIVFLVFQSKRKKGNIRNGSIVLKSPYVSGYNGVR